MGYARHIGRVGALAVTLGVGAAIASTPGIAYAGPSNSSAAGESPSTAADQSTKKSPSTTTKSADKDAASADGDDDSSPSVRKSLRSVLRSAVESIRDRAAGNTPASRDDDTPGTGVPPAQGEDEKDLVSGNLAARKATNTNTSRRAHTRSLADTIGDVASAVTTATQRGEKTFQKLSTSGPTDTATTYSVATAPVDTARTAFTPFSAAPAPVAALAEPEPRSSVVTIVTDLLGSALHPLLYPGTGSPPLQAPSLLAILAATRDEIERILVRRPTSVVYPQTPGEPPYPNPPADPTKQHVLVIAIDGTNMSKVLADPANDKFFALMNTSTSSAPSIVGHTTVSNPSWTAILTGAWDNKTGVINNVYTPWTYDRWPTVFTQLETHNPAIKTKAIADWDVIGAIADSGVGADEVVYISQVENDPNWAKTDDAVTAETVKTINATDPGYQGEGPNFLVTYLVQVDENGHMYGADSIQYEEAIQRTDENLGEILAAVKAREDATGCATNASTCEDWTVIVVTDHGHQPQQGFGHGFQSPDETTTFVIADGPQFGDSMLQSGLRDRRCHAHCSESVRRSSGRKVRRRAPDITSRERLRPSDSGAAAGHAQSTDRHERLSQHHHERGLEPAHDRRLRALLRVRGRSACPDRRRPVRGDERSRAVGCVRHRRVRRETLPDSAAAADHVHTRRRRRQSTPSSA